MARGFMWKQTDLARAAGKIGAAVRWKGHQILPKYANQPRGRYLPEDSSLSPKERVSLSKRLYIERNREKVKSDKQAWILNNRERMRSYVRIRRMRENGVPGTHTAEQWVALKEFYNFTCLSCGRCEPDVKLTEDHIQPISKQGSDDIENIQPLCQSCNSKKSTKTISYLPLHNHLDMKTTFTKEINR